MQEGITGKRALTVSNQSIVKLYLLDSFGGASLFQTGAPPSEGHSQVMRKVPPCQRSGVVELIDNTADGLAGLGSGIVERNLNIHIAAGCQPCEDLGCDSDPLVENFIPTQRAVASSTNS